MKHLNFLPRWLRREASARPVWQGLGVAAAASLLGLTACSVPEHVLHQSALEGAATAGPYATDPHKTSLHLFTPVDINPTITAEQWQPRVDNLFVLLDETGLSGQTYRGIASPIYAREILRRLHRSMPSRTWGGALYNSAASTTSMGHAQGEPLPSPHGYDPARFESDAQGDVAAIGLPGTTLAQEVDALADEVVRVPGRSAIVLITSWQRIDRAALEAVARLRQRHESAKGLYIHPTPALWVGKRQTGLCLHTIGVGNVMSRERTDEADECGSSRAADLVAPAREMSHFVSQLLYAGPADDDGDGIPNFRDACPETPPGRLVNESGCLRFPAPTEVLPRSLAAPENRKP